ncbi:MAG: ferritin-like domain-containing protein [Deltaproteobacteria bacterium]|nr:ferritin-like domain-containing protein [Deltaproteobacteria bacterium]
MIPGLGSSPIRYDMFNLVRDAEEARRLDKCERIYHRGQQMAWDGKEILPMLLAKHGGVKLAPELRKPLMQVFAIILWGELAAWRISSQLADRLVPLEAKMGATSQAFDEARHFYVMYDYLRELDYQVEPLDRAPQALLDLVLKADKLPYKLLGMQLMVEPIALTIFQTVRESGIEPVLCELLRYYERDEARHVGLGMQYLPSMLKEMSKREIAALFAFQVRLMALAMAELKFMEKDLKTIGIDPRTIIDRTRSKQLAALHEALAAVGIDPHEQRNYAAAALNAATEYAFPDESVRHEPRARLEAAWRRFWHQDARRDASEFAVHEHAIKTVHGVQ